MRASKTPSVPVSLAIVALAVFLAMFGVLFFSAQPCLAEQPDSAEAAPAEPAKGDYEAALYGTGVIASFIGEPFYDGVIADEQDALEAVYSVMDRIGGDDTVILEPVAILTTELDVTYYVFYQRVGDTIVHGASIKLVVDGDGHAVGLISAVLPNVTERSLEDWAISLERAEAAVRSTLEEQGITGAEILADASETVIIPLEGLGRFRFAWVVYTNNYNTDIDMPYLAHYVGENGEYLYAIGVSAPGDEESHAGDAAAFPFEKMQQGVWSGTVTTADGSERTLSVPVCIDPATGKAYLADAERKILCADYASFDFEGNIVPRSAEEGEIAANELLIYDCFIRVWDFYDSVGWHGPDGSGTPSLILLDLVDESGTPIPNAFYHGRDSGFQVFAFNRLDPDGECTDVVAHEFTHCVTEATMGGNLYINDYGAINEGMSDIMGNLIEMMIDFNPSGAWLIGENEGESGPYRSMSDPHVFGQPAFVWDVYYVPGVTQGTDNNDIGGVHRNSSILNLVSYRLHQAGMLSEEQFFFWMNVALAMTPRTDYPQLAALLPWCMEFAGFPKYIDAVRDAVAEVDMSRTEIPSTPPSGYGIVRFGYPNKQLAEEGAVYVMIESTTKQHDLMTWPATGTAEVAAVVPPGDYRFTMIYIDDDGDFSEMFIYSDGRWVSSNMDSFDDTLDTIAAFVGSVVHVDEGETVVLSVEGLMAA